MDVSRSKLNSLIYLDNNATARPSEKAISAMMPYWTTYWGTPSTPHQKGQELYPAMSEYYKILYDSIGAQENDRLVLTSSGSEAVNHAIFSAYRDVTLGTGKNHFLTSRTSEAAAVMTIHHLETFGCVSKMIEVDKVGLVTLEALAEILSPRTALLSLSLANGLTGVIQPIVEIVALCRQRGIRLHLDVTHLLGKSICNLAELGADYVTFNGDQLHVPRGTGILYVRQGVPCSPFILGGADQGGMRAGGLNISGLAALACAVQEAIENRDLMCTEIARLRNQLERGIIRHFPRAQVCFKNQERLPHCTALFFPGIANEALLFALNRRGVCASIGGGHFQQIGLMLAACGVEESLANSAVAFSLSRYTTEEEIDSTIQIVAESAQKLAGLSEHLT